MNTMLDLDKYDNAKINLLHLQGRVKQRNQNPFPTKGNYEHTNEELLSLDSHDETHLKS
jgi:hypothetical protein